MRLASRLHRPALALASRLHRPALALLLLGFTGSCSCDESGQDGDDGAGNGEAAPAASGRQQQPEGQEPAGDEPESPLVDALYDPPSSYDFDDNPALLERILSHPHGYFRFVNIPFAKTVCERFSDATASMPAVNLHGDAHLEQYAITEEGRGLTDFDDSSTGPFVLDMVRFGVSVRIAAQANGWGDRADALYDRFLEGYRAALDDPDLEVDAPGCVERFRSRFPDSRKAFLAEVEELMKPLDFDPAELEGTLDRYAETMHAQDPELPEGFFETQGLGSLHVGVGSALDEKYMWRVRGPSEDPMDDIVLEIKEVRDLGGVECLDVSRRDDPFRIMVASSRLSYRPYRFVGYVRWHDKTFWIHAWVDNYRELDVDESIASFEELEAIVYDVGVQLGRGHPSEIADPLDLQLRRALLGALDEQEEHVRETIRELTEAVNAAWKRFESAAK